jgi:hypothetical protein
MRYGHPDEAVADLAGSVSAYPVAVSAGVTRASPILQAERWLQEEL